MKAKYGTEIVEVWQISHDAPTEDWVKAAFEDKKLVWNPIEKDSLQVFSTYSTTAQLGSYLVKLNAPAAFGLGTNFIVADPEAFAKDYQPID